MAKPDVADEIEVVDLSEVKEKTSDIEQVTGRQLLNDNVHSVHNSTCQHLISMHPVLRTMDVVQEFPAVIPLNVGGHHFMTRLSTLCKYEDSMLATMFSGRHKLDCDKDGYFFIDSNGTYFGFILDYLRHEALPPDSMALAVYKEARYYNIDKMVEQLETKPSVARMLVKEAFRKQFPDYSTVKQNIIRAAMEKAAVDRAGEVLVHAFRKEFVPKAPYFNTKHDCVADEAQVSIGPWESSADEEALIKSLESDFMQDGFNIKCHEQRRRCKYYNGQNCQKSVYKLTFLFV